MWVYILMCGAVQNPAHTSCCLKGFSTHSTRSACIRNGRKMMWPLQKLFRKHVCRRPFIRQQLRSQSPLRRRQALWSYRFSECKFHFLSSFITNSESFLLTEWLAHERNWAISCYSYARHFWRWMSTLTHLFHILFNIRLTVVISIVCRHH